MTASRGPVGVGIVGAGVISDNYLTHLASYPDVEVVAIADRDQSRAESVAAAHNIPQHGNTQTLLANADVEVVVNLTVPSVHVEVSLAALAAGKHVWSEKPIGLTRESGQALVDRGRALGKLVGVAPDTILGVGTQQSVRAIRDDSVGQILSAITIVQNPGPDLWHPNPAFLFQDGAGPVLDLGPYYISVLVYAFGPVARVRAVGIKPRARRPILSGPLAGEDFEVTKLTTISAIIEFESGQYATSHFSFDSPLRRAGFVEVTGSEGTIALPDPNWFGGDIRISRIGQEDEVVSTQSAGLGRGLGVVNLARAIRGGGPVIASADLALHVLDVMLAIEEAAASGATIDTLTSVATVPLLDPDWDPLKSTIS